MIDSRTGCVVGDVRMFLMLPGLRVKMGQDEQSVGGRRPSCQNVFPGLASSGMR